MEKTKQCFIFLADVTYTLLYLEPRNFVGMHHCGCGGGNSVAFSSQRNYIDWATATSKRILVPTFVDRGVSRGQRSRTPMVVNLSFLDKSRYFFFKVALHFSPRDCVDPVPDRLLLRKSGSTGNQTWDLCVYSQELWQLDHRDEKFLIISALLYSGSWNSVGVEHYR
jgi:hypothetical protein